HSTDTHSTGSKNPPSRWQLDQPPKDFRSRPLRCALKARQKASAIVLHTDRAVSGAQLIIAAGQRLATAVDQVSRARAAGDPTVLRAAEILKEQSLLDYRLATLPERLAPVLESLIDASTAVSQRVR
ncbi:hypothetical protein ACFWNT_47250, partial [Streptomyces sp. NPDC058409]|uniref:hypothetical protein n=1 Tax=Streptomyces sp. NPDC058409 TaxID=3346484 RepID=UPI0036578EDB